MSSWWRMDSRDSTSKSPLQQNNQHVSLVKKLNKEFDSCESLMKVFLRIRPVENLSLASNTIIAESDTSILTNAPMTSKCRLHHAKFEYRCYSFSRVFAPSTSQKEFFEHMAGPILNRVITGKSCVVFTYGLKNTGKTFTIHGEAPNPGLLPRIAATLFSRSFIVDVSILCVSQDKVCDLLSKSKDCSISLDSEGKMDINNIRKHQIKSLEDVVKYVHTSSLKKSCLKKNPSSRYNSSHVIYTLTVSGKTHTGEKFKAQVTLIDLASAASGKNETTSTEALFSESSSERNATSNLSFWQRCVLNTKEIISPLHVLTSTSIPSADAAITPDSSILSSGDSLLKNILLPLLNQAGNGGVTMIACVSPHADDFDDTIHILKNATMAQKFKDFAELGYNLTKLNNNTQANDHEADSNNSSSSSNVRNACRPTDITNSLGMKRRHQEDDDRKETNKKISLSAPEMNNLVTDEYKELLQLREEVQILRQENQLLNNDRMERETSIRLEVYAEMEAHSENLLKQIDSLQQQLLLYESERDDKAIVRKSTKKLRDTRKDLALQRTAEDLKEAEEELERVKTSTDSQIMSLMTVKQRLESELQVYRNRQQSSSSQKIASSATINASTNETPNVYSPSIKNNNGHIWSPVHNSVSIRPDAKSLHKDAIQSSPIYEDFDSSPLNLSNKIDSFLRSKSKSPSRSPLATVTANITTRPSTSFKKDAVEIESSTLKEVFKSRNNASFF
mmetsp:Transcript_2443/g.3384  ORF Transcript_2443/g.3384 Transcript_2443/m.3384 type:complete len:734 (-) Transcript_2443:4708-6909(-)